MVNTRAVTVTILRVNMTPPTLATTTNPPVTRRSSTSSMPIPFRFSLTEATAMVVTATLMTTRVLMAVMRRRNLTMVTIRSLLINFIHLT